jgi:tRNA G10  N-methylase Trm11
VLLSGEGTTIPVAESKSLFLAYDEASSFEILSPRVLVAKSRADPFRIGSRIAFARRVGMLVEDFGEAADMMKGKRVRFACFDLGSGKPPPDPAKYLEGIDATIDLTSPDFEVTLVRAREDHLAVTMPETMSQGWSRRRPRARPFFHPSAIFPKLSRALVNLSRCREGELFLDPFAGTGSLLLEAELVGAQAVAVDLTAKMARGSVANMRQFGQRWVGVVRADSTFLPMTGVDAVATDIPYGRASSTRGKSPNELLEMTLPELARVLKPESLLVLMHPKDVEVTADEDFSVLEEHDLHVHKLLTRTISVLRRR